MATARKPPLPTGYIRVPNPETYAKLPFTERRRLYKALKQLQIDWALAELAEFKGEDLA